MQAAHTMNRTQLVEHIAKGLVLTNTKFKCEVHEELPKPQLVEMLTWLRCKYQVRRARC